jgi:hypothetical protein
MNDQEVSAKPTKRTKQMVATRKGPYKLTEKLISDFVAYIQETGGPIEFHLQAAGIGKSTYCEWREEVKSQPNRIYSRFVEQIDKALGERLKMLYRKAEHARPWEILFRQFPSLFPVQSQPMTLIGENGAPLFPTESQFAVSIELASPDPAGEKEFTIVDVDGKKHSWADYQRKLTNGDGEATP